MRSSAFLLLIITIFFAKCTAQSQIVETRLEITKRFFESFRPNVLTNEEIIKQYVQQENYFQVDSIKRMADYYMDHIRLNFTNFKMTDYNVIKLQGDEPEFFVDGVRDIGEDSNTIKRRKLILASPDGSELDIDLDDLYGIRVKIKTEFHEENGVMLVLFDERNKIVSFFSIAIGEQTTLMRF